MFKKKTKKSHKNDEIFVDYSKDIDVKNNEEDEAKPEHYEALKVHDEVVVSSAQIKEAKVQEQQDEFIKQKQQKIEEEMRKNSAPVEAGSKREEPIKISEEKDLTPAQNDGEGTVIEYHYQDDNVVQEDVNHSSEEPIVSGEHHIDNEDIKSDDFSEEKKPQNIQDSEVKRYQKYPSFLQEEMEGRRAETYPKKSQHSEPDLSDVDEQEHKENLTPKSKYDRPLQSVEIEQMKETPIAKEDIEPKTNDNLVQKQDLSRYFDIDKSVLKKEAKKYLKEKAKKPIVQKPVYSYKHHDFEDMNDFISFIEEHLYNLEDIASELLKDELFFRWLQDESSHFEDSVIKMKKLKQELKQ